jgi:hypothetical protein
MVKAGPGPAENLEMGDGVDRAVADLAAISTRMGRRAPRRVTNPSAAAEAVDRCRRELAPLRLPEDLVEFWLTWDATTFDVLSALHITLFSPDQAWESDDWIRILLPITQTQYSSLALELGSSRGPGGRLYDLSSHFPSHHLGWGMVDLLDLLVEALHRGHDPDGPMEDNAYFALLDATARDRGSVEIGPQGSWPLAWLEAEGYTLEWLTPRGATHSISDFESQRADGSPFRAVLRGRWRVTSSFGGRLRDDSGSLTLTVPSGVQQLVAERDGQVEVEIESLGPPAAPVSPLDTDEGPPATAGDERAGSEVERLAEQVLARRLRSTAGDPDLRVLAIRPVRAYLETDADGA